MNSEAIDPQFAEDVRRGLSAEQKYLVSRYFYDASGDRLFQQIMRMPEYYLTDCELDVLRTRGREIAEEIARSGPFELVELGCGDGRKVHHLLDALNDIGAEFVFRPVDISPHVLELLEEHLRPGRPWLDMRPLAANYMEWLDALRDHQVPRAFAFLGSNLGNFRRAAAVDFLSLIRRAMDERDALLIGLDLKKDPAVIKAAYDDPQGITAQFNLNLLERINRELGGDFEPERFSHRPHYDPDTGEATSWLRSEARQRVRIEALQQSFEFDEGERIFMEISQKYDQPMLDGIAHDAGFRVAAHFEDARGWFTDQVWRPLPAAEG